jgi:F0F1-type ATP synthase membrane subunit b/b'
MMEFIIALMPVLLAFLGFTQFCFAGIAKLSVRHAAALATRAAVVVLEEAEGIPGAPGKIYGGFKAGGLEVDRPADAKGGAAANNSQNQVSQVTNGSNANSNESKGRSMDVLGSVERTETRIKQIRTAAYVPLLAVSPNLADEGIDIASGLGSGQVFQRLKVSKAIGNAGLERAFGALLYNMGAVAVTFPRAPDKKAGIFELNELITARVTYLFRCQVPLASLLMCSSGWSLLFGDAWFDPIAMRSIARMVGDPPKKAEDLPQWTAQWKQEKSIHDRQQQRVDAFKGHEKEFDQVEWPFMLDVLLAIPGARYMVLSAEAQLPLQSAKYYPRADDKDMERVWDEQEKKKKNEAQMPDVRKVLEPVQKLVSDAANQIDKQVDEIKDTVADIKQQVADGVSTATSTYNDAKGQVTELVHTAQSAFDDAKRKVNDTLAEANKTFNKAKATAEATVKGVREKADGLVDDAHKELDKANAELRKAQKAGGAAVQAAEQQVASAQAQVNQAERDATSMVQNAEAQARQQIDAAQHELDDVQKQGKEIMDQAQGTLDHAKSEAQGALDDAKGVYDGAVAQGKGLVRDTKGEASRALSGVQSTASQAVGSLSNAANDAANSAAKGVTKTATDLTEQLKNVKPGMSLDDF